MNLYIRQGGCVFVGVSWLVCLLAGLRKNYSTDVYNITMFTRKKPLGFDDNSDHVTLGLGLPPRTIEE